jgi:5-methylcytosine-specific restriction endonuclease McrA
MPDIIYVLGMDGKPQMPTKRKRHVKKLLDSGKARIAAHVPFTIQLRYENEPVTQPILLAEDPGRTNIGVSTLSEHGELLLAALVETRNKEIPKLMKKRKVHRQASRNGERKARQRLAKRDHTMMQAELHMRKRRLPGYGEDGYILCKYILNTEARFANRKRPDGWLTPTAKQLVQTHINLAHKIARYLPVTDVAIEVNRFAFMLLEHPETSGIDFQNGPLKGYDDLFAAVSDIQHGKCLLCGNDIEHYHHIIPKHKSGSNTVKNLAGLCEHCHELVHTDPAYQEKLLESRDGLYQKYGALSVLNQAFPYICQELQQEFGSEHFFVVDPKDTAKIRDSLGFTKDQKNQLHEVDAYCIGLTALNIVPDHVPAFDSVYQIRQFRRHERSLIKSQRERTYKLNDKTVAKNRKPRFEQSGDALSDWYEKQVSEHGKNVADAMRSNLTVAKSTRYYNSPDRLMPGTLFYCYGKLHVLSGQLSNGQYYRAVGDAKTNYPAKKCRVVRPNEGLVFIGKAG